MDLIYITKDIFFAKVAQDAGVDRVMVDLEINGKIERQGHLDTVISHHTLQDIENIRAIINKTDLMVRVNPIDSGSSDEINACIELGADILMLPMFTTVNEVEKFIKVVNGRAKICLLLETGQALARAHDILVVEGIDEVHIGLNDLSLALKLDFMFELLSGGVLDYLAQILRSKKIKFGFGGVGRLNQGLLSSNLIVAEHARLGSTQVILSRDFNRIFENTNKKQASEIFTEEVGNLRSFISTELPKTDDEYARNFDKVKQAVNMIVGHI